MQFHSWNEPPQFRHRDFNSHYLRGACYQSLERRDDALRAWRTALKLNPAHARLLQIMVVEYGKGRYFQEAAEVARRALELAPNDANAYYLAIKSLQDAGQYPEALEIAGRAVNRFPQSARAHFEYGFHLQKVGQTDQALQELEKAMALDPSYEEPPFFFGDLMQTQGRYEEAILFLQRPFQYERIMFRLASLWPRPLWDLRNGNKPSKSSTRPFDWTQPIRNHIFCCRKFTFDWVMKSVLAARKTCL